MGNGLYLYFFKVLITFFAPIILNKWGGDSRQPPTTKTITSITTNQIFQI